MIIHTGNNNTIEVIVNDSSFRYRAIMGDNRVTLYYELPEHVEIPVGSWIEYEGARYTLLSPENLKKKHSRYYEYTVIFEGAEARAKTWKIRNMVDHRLKFSLTAKPHEHLQLIVDNLNARESGWTVGDCIDDVEKCINYNHNYIYEGLQMIADEYGTEFEFSGKVVSLHKVEYNKSTPLALEYGKGKGLKSGVGRTSSDKQPIEVLYTEGGETNIDASKYGARELHLPKNGELGYDGTYYSYQEGYSSSQGRMYVADADGYSVRRKDKALTSGAEDSLDCTEVYPKRVGKVTSLVTVDEDKNFYDIVDDTIPDTLNYSDYLIAGEKMTIIFQSGMLAGREFDVNYYHTEKDGKAAKRFEIVPAEIDGITMPGGAYLPKTEDKYAVFNCMLPDAYINEPTTHEGAEWDMMRSAVKYLYENEERKLTFSGSLDGIWSAKDWINIGGKIKLGGYVSLKDPNFQQQAVLVRIVGIKDYINKPHSPEIELSNDTITSGFSSTINDIKGDEVTIDENAREAREYAKRGFRDAKETMQMLQNALLDGFTDALSPITLQTMQVLVGDESLQYRFVTNKTAPVIDSNFSISYNAETKVLSVTGSILQHMTLGIKDMSSAHEASEYMFFTLPSYASAPLTETDKSYYLYAKCNKSDKTGTFILSTTPVKMEAVEGYYHFLVGILNKEREGNRSFVTLYGFTEILPGQVLTDLIRSSDGQTWWDLTTGYFKLRDKLKLDENGLTLNQPLVQTGSGAMTVLGAFCGDYSSTRIYQLGDEVIGTVSGLTSTYRYINSVPSRGHGLTDTNYWTPVAKGAKGEDGRDGVDGDDGRGISSTTVEYAVSQSGATAPVTGWSTTLPAVVAGFYLWSRTTIVYTDSAPNTISYSVSRMGVDGEAGKDGKGIAAPYQGEYDSAKTYYGNSVRCDVVRYNNQYYIALSTVNGSFSGKLPTNTAYWTPFGASFDNIATGLLFAEEAWVENLGVSFLKTGVTGKRVMINDNGNHDISVYNGTEERVRITGDSIGRLSELFVELYKDRTGSVAVMNDTYNAKQYDYSKLLYTLSISQNVGQGDTVSLRNVIGEVSALPSAVTAGGDGSVTVNFSNISISYGLYNGNTAVKTIASVDLMSGQSGDEPAVLSTSYYDYTRPLTSNLSDSGWSIRVTFQATMERNYVIGRLTSCSARYGLDAYIIRAGKKKMLIGSDGFFYTIGPQQYVFVSNNDSISLRAGNAGITLKDDKLLLRMGGKEYEATVYNNALRLTAV